MSGGKCECPGCRRCLGGGPCVRIDNEPEKRCWPCAAERVENVVLSAVIGAGILWLLIDACTQRADAWAAWWGF